jgi:FAD/FMN-containing dehydrogenase
LRGALPEGAFAIVTRCPLEAKPRFDVWGVPTADLAVMRAVKQALDPKDILNRGRFLV